MLARDPGARDRKAATMSDFFAEWDFRPEVVDAMRVAYRMACEAPQLRLSADERTAIVASASLSRE
jgi:hypothetical protein